MTGLTPAHLPGAASGAAGTPGATGDAAGADRSLRVTVPEPLAEQAGAILMDFLGPFEEERPAATPAQPCPTGAEPRVTLVFYPAADGPSTREDLLLMLPEEFAEAGALEVEAGSVSRDWVEGWRAHFRPIVIGAVRIRPPWEAPQGAECEAGPAGESGARSAAGGPLIDVVINPGLGFGTGLHPTTRGTLFLLQEGPEAASRVAAGAAGSALGPLTDVGTGSGILAIAAAKLGWGPVIALDNDPVALVSTRENVTENGVDALVEIHEADTDSADEAWFDGATVLANMTLEPVSMLLKRLAGLRACPRRLVVSGILAGSQEEQIMLIAHESGFVPGRRQYETEWVSFELLPDRAGS
jgi:ribosomal protein L11 methyltransferase